MKTKKMEQLLNKQRKQLVRYLDDAITINSDKTRKMLRELKATKTIPNCKKNETLPKNTTNQKNRTIAKMIRELYFISGTSSGSEEYLHMVGEDAILLKLVKDNLSNNIPISNSDINELYKIYCKFFPDGTMKIKEELGLI